MYQIDYQVLDKLLAKLFEADRRYPVYIAEELASLYNEKYRLTPEYYEMYPKYIAELRELELATETGEATIMEITTLGRKVHKAGGWIKYSQQLVADKIRQEEEKAYDRKVTVQSARSARSSARAAWLTGGLSIIPIALGIIQYFEANSKDKEFEVIKKNLQAVSQQLRVQKANAIETRHLLDSLFTLQKAKSSSSISLQPDRKK